MMNYTQNKINELLSDYNVSLWSEALRMSSRATHSFKNCNKAWYEGKFSTRENIGGVMKLLEDCKPSNKEEWINFYFNSGDKALVLKSSLKNYKKINSINISHGKTIMEVLELAKQFHKLLNGYSLEECFNYAFIHIIDETYLGYEREQKSAKLLDDFCAEHGLVLNDANNYKDIVTGVDYEIKSLSGVLICGIQVKGVNAIYETTQLMVDNMNILKERNNQYMEETGANVLYMLMDNDNTLYNITLFDEIIEEAKNKAINCTVSSNLIQKNSQIDKFNKKFGR